MKSEANFTGLDIITKLLSIKLLIVNIFLLTTVLTYVFGVQKNPLIETILLSPHNICLIEK